MNRIDSAFGRLRRRKQKALIAYLTVGFPRVGLLPKLVQALVEAGVDLVELGVPFSDPLADGPTIQKASQSALWQGVTTQSVLRAVADLRRKGISVPLILMTYINPVLRYGIDRFCRDAVGAGADGIIVPDLPPEEGKQLKKAAVSSGLQTIFLASPTSSPKRLREIVKISSGFVYYVSLTGVTGARNSLPGGVSAQVAKIHRISRLPVCVGFGISRPEQARQILAVADGVVIGSRLLDEIGRSVRNPAQAAARFIRPFSEVCHA